MPTLSEIAASPQIFASQEFSPNYQFSVSHRPSNRIQVKISPSYSSKGKKSSDRIQKLTQLNIELSEQYKSGDKQGALAALKPHQRRIKRSAGAGVSRSKSGAWHLYQTAAWKLLPSFLISWIWKTLKIPGLTRPKIFTPTARLGILDAGGALEKEGYKPEDFYFFTGTLPGSTAIACEFFARNSRPFLDSLKNYLRRELGLYLTFNCWEWQMRINLNLTPALHLHMVIVCPDKELGGDLHHLLMKKWLDLLDYYGDKYCVNLYEKAKKLWTDSERAAGYGYWSREELYRLAKRKNNPFDVAKTVRCNKSPAAYLSKYVGKGALSEDKQFQQRFKGHNLPLYYPSSWWSISDAVRQIINKYCCVYSFRNTLDECMRAYHALQEIIECDDYDLLALNLPVFIPEWANGSRLYRNFYCKNEHYDKCCELAQSFAPQGLGVSASGNFTNKFNDISTISVCSKDNLIYYFNKVENYRQKDKLLYSIPFYHRLNGGTDVDWDNPLVLWNARKIRLEPIDYPEPESLEQRLAKLKIKEQKHESDRYQSWLQSHVDGFNYSRDWLWSDATAMQLRLKDLFDFDRIPVSIHRVGVIPKKSSFIRLSSSGKITRNNLVTIKRRNKNETYSKVFKSS